MSAVRGGLKENLSSLQAEILQDYESKSRVVSTWILNEQALIQRFSLFSGRVNSICYDLGTEN